MEGFGGNLVAGSGIGEAGVLADEVFHAQDATHPAGVIAEEDAAKGGKGTDEICLDGDGGFDSTGVGGAGDDDSAGHVLPARGGLVWGSRYS